MNKQESNSLYRDNFLALSVTKLEKSNLALCWWLVSLKAIPDKTTTNQLLNSYNQWARTLT